jgi:hypothetical protein
MAPQRVSRIGDLADTLPWAATEASKRPFGLPRSPFLNWSVVVSGRRLTGRWSAQTSGV